MSALTADFDSSIKNVRATQSYIAATGTVIYAGGLVQINASGLAIAALGGSNLKIVGRARTSLDGTEAALSTVTAEEGDVIMNLDATNPPAQANIGAIVYATSDNEVGTSAGANAKAGVLVAIEGSQARVRVTLEATI